MTATQIVGGLYIGDIHDVREGDTSTFDHVIGVCQDDCSENVSCQYSHYSLRDGPYDSYGRGEFSKDLLVEAIDAVISARIQRKTVLVHCHAGKSRSATVVIAAIAAMRDIPWSEAYEIVDKKRDIQPNGRLVDWAKEYLEGE